MWVFRFFRRTPYDQQKCPTHGGSDMTPEEMGLTRTCGTCKAKPGVACVIRRRGDELRMHGTRQMLGVGSYNRWRYGPNGPS